MTTDLNYAFDFTRQATLTDRNKQVLIAIYNGIIELDGDALTQSGLAQRMGLAKSTIHSHVQTLRSWHLLEEEGYGLWLSVYGERVVKDLLLSR